MAFSKITLNGVTLMDVTQKTVTAASMLKDVTALKNDGTDVAGNIASKTASDLSVSGATVTAPSGFYGSDVSASVDSMTLPTSASTSSNSGTRKATIGRSTSTQYINIPAGYNDTKAYYQISAVANGSAATPATTITANPTISVGEDGLITATTSASRSITPTVTAGYVSSGTSGTVTVSGSNTSQLATQAAQTIYPSTSDQTITSGQYLTGTQTIKKVVVSDSLNASNIKAGVTITIGDEDDADRIITVTGTYSVDPETVTMINGATAASTSATFENDVYILSTLQVTGTFTSLKLYVEGRCNAAGDWIKLAFIDQTDYILTDGATGITAKGIYEASVAGINQYRVRVESIAGGNVSVVSVFTR